MSTAHCSACEAALDLMFSMPEMRGWSLRVVEVAEDESLVERYGARLPVLLLGGKELSWPFGAAEVRGLLDIVRTEEEGGTGA